MAKKSTTKKAPAAKKVAVKKVAVKKTATKKAPAKTAVKKAPARKAAKKAAPKKSAKKSSSRKAATRVVARVDVGFGNAVFIRGEGAGLSWTKGVELECVSPVEWAVELKGGATYKLLLNDELWAEGENGSVASGATDVTSPEFDG